MDSLQRRVILSRILKLMSMAAFLAVLLVLFADTFSRHSPTKTIHVAVEAVKLHGSIEKTWNGLPVLFVYRDAQVVSQLGEQNTDLRDPFSHNSRQPAFARNAWRSRMPSIMVLVALGTAIDCPVSPVYNDALLTGFTDRCRGWRYDAAGRVFEHQEALKNLVVPPYSIENDVIYVGKE